MRVLETAVNGLHLDRTGHTHPLLDSSEIGKNYDEDEKTENTNPLRVDTMLDGAFVRGRDGTQRIARTFGNAWAAHVRPFLSCAALLLRLIQYTHS
jgi:hypothetical protein